MKKKLLLQDISDLLVQPGHAGKKDADNFVRAFFDIVEQGLLEDQFVKIKGLGTFKLVSVSDRESVNINTGERFQISGHTKISFTPDNAMKELVNRPFAHFEAVDLSEDTDTAEFDLIDQEIALMEQEARTEEAETTPTQPEAEAEAPNCPPEEKAEATIPDAPAGDEEAPQPEETPATGLPQTIVTPKSNDVSTTISTDNIPEDLTEEKVEEKEEEKEEGKGEEENDTGQTTTIIVPLTDDEPAAELPEGNDAPATADDAAEETVPAQNAEDQDAAEDSDALPAADEEIGVSAPRAITQTTDFTAQQPADNSLTPANYTYCETPPKPRYKWLKRIAASAGILLLLVLCYFAGYYRLLCPCQLPCIPWFDDEMTAAQPAAQPTPSANDAQTKERPAVPAVPTATKPEQSAPASTPAAQPAAQPQDREKAQPEADSPKPIQASPSTQLPTQQQSKTREKQATTQQPAKSEEAGQDAKPRYHTVRKGENLTQISRRYYGSDSYVQKIIRKNHLSDANNIIPGTRLLLP